MKIKITALITVLLTVILFSACDSNRKYVGHWVCREGNDSIMLNIKKAGKAYEVYDNRWGFGDMVFTEDHGVLKGPLESIITVKDNGDILYRGHNYVKR